MKKDEGIFMPLNISYVQKRDTDRKVVFGIISLGIFIVGVIIALSISNSFMFSPILGSKPFLIIMILIAFYIATLFLRKFVFKEKELMRLYAEMLEHEITTLNNIWEIFIIENNVASFYDSSSKVFLKCESGFTVSRPPNHESQHRDKVRDFIAYLTKRGYSIDYYNYKNRDANVAPLDNTEKLIRRNKNKVLQDYGATLLKKCRTLGSVCEESKVEYWVVTAPDVGSSAYLEASVEVAASILQGSVYTNIQICGESDIVEFLELVFKIKGINITEMTSGQLIETSQKIIRIVKTYASKDMVDTNEGTDEASLVDFQAYLAGLEQERKESEKESKGKNPNLAQVQRKTLIPAPIVDKELGIEVVPVLLEDDSPEESVMPISIDYGENEFITPTPLDEDDEDELPLPIPMEDEENINTQDDEEDISLLDDDDDEEELL